MINTIISHFGKLLHNFTISENIKSIEARGGQCTRAISTFKDTFWNELKFGISETMQRTDSDLGRSTNCIVQIFHLMWIIIKSLKLNGISGHTSLSILCLPRATISRFFSINFSTKACIFCFTRQLYRNFCKYTTEISVKLTSKAEDTS